MQSCPPANMATAPTTDTMRATYGGHLVDHVSKNAVPPPPTPRGIAVIRLRELRNELACKRELLGMTKRPAPFSRAAARDHHMSSARSGGKLPKGKRLTALYKRHWTTYHKQLARYNQMRIVVDALDGAAKKQSAVVEGMSKDDEPVFVDVVTDMAREAIKRTPTPPL